ncbi:hypothetical protein PtA15_13A253 [Puccinia triticina]|uniref:26S proteasome regulatory subunit Rpn7 N-terminal domain-containing protein n=1 Tax=Puccinia triticina TaxID=208348 RepID=A0ABY7D2N3_9BASI|nr:uncharacterized protein PtA15_13A253 [Puccinia triticina]WAQ90853.1 hypothetical protein PtA15_13A253 [Puccinia triticina]
MEQGRCCIINSAIWGNVHYFQLTQNLWLINSGDPDLMNTNLLFHEWLLSIGNGSDQTEFTSDIELRFGNIYKHSNQRILAERTITMAYGDIHMLTESTADKSRATYFGNRLILAPLNSDVNQINRMCLALITTPVFVSHSIKQMRNEEDVQDSDEAIPEEVLCTFSIPGFPEANLELKVVGDVGSAHQVFSKAREHATTALHAAELSLASLDLALDAENFNLAQSHAAKAQGALDTLIGSLELKAAKTKTSGSTSTVGIDSRDPTKKDIQRWSDRVNVVNALTSLAQGDFGRATSYFLKVGKDAGESTGGELLATATDIAIYTTLCGLAHFDRQQLKDRLIDNLEFRSMLDSEPQLRRILNLFRENKYCGVFEYLKASLVICICLMMMIQEWAIGQYFGSFSSAQLSKASEVFGWPMDELEQRLVLSIRSGHLPAKLDLANSILRAHQPTPRSRLLANVTSSAKKIQHDSSAALFCLKLISADLLVRDVNQPNIPSLTPSSEPVDRSKLNPLGSISRQIGKFSPAFWIVSNRYICDTQKLSWSFRPADTTNSISQYYTSRLPLKLTRKCFLWFYWQHSRRLRQVPGTIANFITKDSGHEKHQGLGPDRGSPRDDPATNDSVFLTETESSGTTPPPTFEETSEIPDDEGISITEAQPPRPSSCSTTLVSTIPRRSTKKSKKANSVDPASLLTQGRVSVPTNSNTPAASDNVNGPDLPVVNTSSATPLLANPALQTPATPSQTTFDPAPQTISPAELFKPTGPQMDKGPRDTENSAVSDSANYGGKLPAPSFLPYVILLYANPSAAY